MREQSPSPSLPVSPAQLKIAAWWRSTHYLTEHVAMLDVAGECQIHIKGSDAAYSLNLLIVCNAHFLLWKLCVVLPGITEMDIWSHGARARAGIVQTHPAQWVTLHNVNCIRRDVIHCSHIYVLIGSVLITCVHSLCM